MIDELIGTSRAIATAWTETVAGAVGFPLPKAPPLAQTPRDELPLEGGAKLLHFRGASLPVIAKPILLVPSLINRWYVLDLRPGASLVEALVGAGFDVWLLDWGMPQPEDRYLDWDSVLRRLGRAARRVQRETSAKTIGLFGYCMGGTLSSIYAAQHAEEIQAFVTLAAPIDFSLGGKLREMVDPRWFDPGAVADAGNVTPSQMQAGFTALRPTLDAAKMVSTPELMLDKKQRDGFLALDAWASDNIPFPGEAYRRYISEMYQRNELVNGTHRANGLPALLSAIKCPVLTITASKDQICPPPAATALLNLVGSTDKSELQVPGGHVGAVVGSKASKEMYPGLTKWLAPRLS
ncbi:MAG TPA: alpha/beta fold hydrolase [Kofleriaceae bacterium]